MSRLHLAVTDGELASVSSGDTAIVVIIAVIAALALASAYMFGREVLAAGQGTPKMQDISRAVQEGAAAYLARQFRTLGIFAVIVFFLLFLLPAEGGGVRIGRSVAFLFGGLFSALVGYVGMTLATRANVRVAAAAQSSTAEKAMRIAIRSGGVVEIGRASCRERV